MKRKIFFVPIDEIIDFAESATENQLKAVIVATAHNVVVFSVEYNSQIEKLVIIDLESSLKQGCCVDGAGENDGNEVWIRKIS